MKRNFSFPAVAGTEVTGRISLDSKSSPKGSPRGGGEKSGLLDLQGLKTHLTFICQGKSGKESKHTCLGIHLARLPPSMPVEVVRRRPPYSIETLENGDQHVTLHYLATSCELWENLTEEVSRRVVRACPRGDKCWGAHTLREMLYHPREYKSKMCLSKSCSTSFCAFCHSEAEKQMWDRYRDTLFNPAEQNLIFSKGIDYSNGYRPPLLRNIEEINTPGKLSTNSSPRSDVDEIDGMRQIDSTKPSPSASPSASLTASQRKVIIQNEDMGAISERLAKFIEICNEPKDKVESGRGSVETPVKTPVKTPVTENRLRPQVSLVSGMPVNSEYGFVPIENSLTNPMVTLKQMEMLAETSMVGSTIFTGSVFTKADETIDETRGSDRAISVAEEWVTIQIIYNTSLNLVTMVRHAKLGAHLNVTRIVQMLSELGTHAQKLIDCAVDCGRGVENVQKVKCQGVIGDTSASTSLNVSPVVSERRNQEIFDVVLETISIQMRSLIRSSLEIIMDSFLEDCNIAIESTWGLTDKMVCLQSRIPAGKRTLNYLSEVRELCSNRTWKRIVLRASKMSDKFVCAQTFSDQITGSNRLLILQHLVTLLNSFSGLLIQRNSHGDLVPCVKEKSFPFSAHSSTHPSANYKVSLCRNYVRSGTCPRGSECNFAHGAGELRVDQREVRQ